MTPSRLVTAIAVVLTAILFQATVVGPVLEPLPGSLPLVVVLVIAVLCGPSAGISVGFGAGLVLDLCSTHPAGVLAATWLGAGLAGGVLGGLTRTLRTRAGLIGALGGVSAVASAVVLWLLDAAAAPLPDLLVRSIPGAVLDALLAVVVLPVAGAMLASPALRPRPTARPLPTSEPRLPMDLSGGVLSMDRSVREVPAP